MNYKFKPKQSINVLIYDEWHFFNQNEFKKQNNDILF